MWRDWPGGSSGWETVRSSGTGGEGQDDRDTSWAQEPVAPDADPEFIADQPAALAPDRPDTPDHAPRASLRSVSARATLSDGRSSSAAKGSWRWWLRHYLAPHGLRLLLAQLGVVIVFAIAVALLTNGGSDDHPPARTIGPAATTIPARSATVSVATTTALASQASDHRATRRAARRHRHRK